MKLIEVTRPISGTRGAFLPSGGLFILEHKQDGKVKVEVYTAGVKVDVKESFEKIRDDVNAWIEGWR